MFAVTKCNSYIYFIVVLYSAQLWRILSAHIFVGVHFAFKLQVMHIWENWVAALFWSYNGWCYHTGVFSFNCRPNNHTFHYVEILFVYVFVWRDTFWVIHIYVYANGLSKCCSRMDQCHKYQNCIKPLAATFVFFALDGYLMCRFAT